MISVWSIKVKVSKKVTQYFKRHLFLCNLYYSMAVRIFWATKVGQVRKKEWRIIEGHVFWGEANKMLHPPPSSSSYFCNACLKNTHVLSPIEKTSKNRHTYQSRQQEAIMMRDANFCLSQYLILSFILYICDLMCTFIFLILTCTYPIIIIHR